MEKMTKEQIENFRKVLVLTLGAYALIMPDEQVIAIRNRMQSQIDQAEKDRVNKQVERKPFVVNKIVHYPRAPFNRIKGLEKLNLLEKTNGM